MTEERKPRAKPLTESDIRRIFSEECTSIFQEILACKKETKQGFSEGFKSHVTKSNGKE